MVSTQPSNSKKARLRSMIANPFMLATFAFSAIAAFHAPAITWEKKVRLGEIVDFTVARIYLGTCAAMLLVAAYRMTHPGRNKAKHAARTGVVASGAWLGSLIGCFFVFDSLMSIDSMYEINNGNVADWWWVDALDDFEIYFAGCLFWCAAAIGTWLRARNS